MAKPLSVEIINERLRPRNVQMLGNTTRVGEQVAFQCCKCQHIFTVRLGQLLYNLRKKGEFCSVCEDYAKKERLLSGNLRTIQRSKNKNLKGAKFGNVLVISNLIYSNSKGYNCVRGICDCGNMVDLRISGLRIQRPKKYPIECRACYLERNRQNVMTWKVGQRFGSLVIISEEVIIKRNRYIQTRCDCGNIETNSPTYLTLKGKKICTRYRLDKHMSYNRERADRYLALFGCTRITEDIPNGNVRILYQCKCGRKNRILLSHLQQMIEKDNKTLICRCDKIKNGVSTSYAALKLHDNLGRGIHNYAAKCGNVDIALCHKGKKIAIEYDEWWWHKDRYYRDKKKTDALIKDGWHVLRLRVSNFIPDEKFLKRAINKLIKRDSHLLIVTHKSWRGYIGQKIKGSVK